MSSAKHIFARAEHGIVLTVFILLALVLSFPLITQFNTHIAGVQGDVWSYLWAMGWARISLLNLAVNPFHTDYVYYPLGGATQLLWGTALPSFASLPLQLAFGLVPAFNLMYLAASVLTGYGTYLLARNIFRALEPASQNKTRGIIPPPSAAALVASIAFTFSPLRLGYGLAFTNLFHTEFIPFYLLFLLQATRTRRWKHTALAGIFFAFNAYIDFQIAAFLALTTALWIAFVIGRELVRAYKTLGGTHALRTAWKNIFPALTRWAAIGAIAFAAVLPMLGLVLNDFAIEGGNYIRVYPLRYSADRSYDVLSFFLPNARSTLYQNLPVPRVENVNASVSTPDESELSPDRQAFLGLTLLLLALAGTFRFGRKMLFWIAVTLVFAILSLGPVLHLAGVATEIPLPFALINNVPVLNNIRIPMRYGLMMFFGLSMVAGAGALVLIQWKNWVWLVLSALLLVEAAVLPYPTQEFRVPQIYERIAQAPGDFAVLDIPTFNWRFAAQNEAYQVIHQKRILRAYTNRIAPDIAEYFNLRQTPIVVRSLRILEGAEKGILTPEEIHQDASVLDDTLAFFNLRYAVLHRDQLPAERVIQIDDYVRNVMHGRVIDDDGTSIAYEFPQTTFSENSRALDLASNTTLMYLGRGWQTEPLADEDGSQGRYANAASNQVYVPQSNAARLDLDFYSEDANTSIATTLNETRGETISLQQGWQTYTLAAQLQQRLNLLTLRANTNAPKPFAFGALEQR